MFTSVNVAGLSQHGKACSVCVCLGVCVCVGAGGGVGGGGGGVCVCGWGGLLAVWTVMSQIFVVSVQTV